MICIKHRRLVPGWPQCDSMREPWFSTPALWTCPALNLRNMLGAIGRSAVKRRRGTEVCGFEIHGQLVTLGRSVSLLMIKTGPKRQQMCAVLNSESFQLDRRDLKGDLIWQYDNTLVTWWQALCVIIYKDLDKAQLMINKKKQQLNWKVKSNQFWSDCLRQGNQNISTCQISNSLKSNSKAPSIVSSLHHSVLSIYFKISKQKDGKFGAKVTGVTRTHCLQPNLAADND